MEFHVLASGSKGNSTFIFDEGIGILIEKSFQPGRKTSCQHENRDQQTSP